ncbi:MAG: hypothetical protein JRK53_29245 [Deltaproteobacteria bacterium]|nr:hypothetical protein [Deltaproteobacteria bacterium]
MAESSKQKSQPKTALPGSPNRWTVMILRGMGQVRSFRVSTRFIFCCLLFLGLYVAASVLVINQYFIELRAHKTQVALLTQLQREIEGTQKELFRSRQQLAMLKDHILKDTTGEKKKRPEPARDAVVASEAGPDPMEAQASLDSPVHQGGDDGRPALAEIRGLSVRKSGAQLEIRFRLVNINARDEHLKGYVHIIAVETASDPPQIWTYPKVALRKGAPVDFKSGYHFSIKNYIDIKVRMFLNKESDSPSHLKQQRVRGGGGFLTGPHNGPCYYLDLAGAEFAEDARHQAHSCKLYRTRLITPQIRQNRRPRRVNNLEKIW